jgi:hypothetical protein
VCRVALVAQHQKPSQRTLEMVSIRSLRNVALASVFGASVASAQAGLLSNSATVNINATKQSSLTVTVNSGGTQTLAALSDNTTNDFVTPVNVTTAWDINPSASAVVLVGYFSTPAQALVSGVDYIASSLVKARVGAIGAYNAFSGGVVNGGASSVGVAGGSLQFFSEAINGTNKNSSRTDDVYLQIDLTGQTVNAGTYAGTLNLRAITQ